MVNVAGRQSHPRPWSSEVHLLTSHSALRGMRIIHPRGAWRLVCLEVVQQPLVVPQFSLFFPHGCKRDAESQVGNLCMSLVRPGHMVTLAAREAGKVSISLLQPL